MSTATVAAKPTDDLRARSLAARDAARILAATPGAVRDAGLAAIASTLEAEREAMLAANAVDLHAAEELAARGQLGMPLVARLNLAKGKYERAVDSVRSV